MSQTVCVTGASGFIASVIVRDLLDQGYHVRGTVRSLEKPEKYDFLTSLPGAGQRLQLFEAELLTEGCFDQAVDGCDYVLHTASPYVLTVEDPQADLVDPAVQGTLNVLRSCSKADSVRRVVLTSSMAAVTDEPDSDHVFTEADWNEKSSLERNPYYYSKMLAERAAWDYMEDHQPHFDLVVINPTLVFGPSISPGLNQSNKVIADLLTGAFPGIMNITWGMVDVRDVARAHILAMENPQASGRYICVNEVWSMQQVVDLLKEKGYEKYKLPGMNLTSGFGDALIRMISYLQPKGVGSYLRSHVGREFRIDNSKIRSELGIDFRPVEESVLETVDDLIRSNDVPDLAR